MELTAIGYARKSIQLRGIEQEEQSVLYQTNEIEGYAKQNDIHVVKTYSDIGYSGVLRRRPELNNMLDFLKNREEKIDVLLMYNQDRLARDLSVSIELMLEITELVDEVVFVVDDVSTSVKNFRETFLMNAARVAEDRKNLKKRLRGARKARVVYNQQYRSTQKPLGYVQPRKDKLKLATVEHTRDLDLTNDLIIAQCIFLAYLAKMSLRQIATWLNETFGLTKRGKNWSDKSVKYILENPVYAGILSSIFLKKAELKPVETIQPLLSMDMYNYIQMRLKSEKPGKRSSRLKYLPDIALCQQCMEPLELKVNHYKCNGCDGEMDIEVYKKVVKKHFQSLLNGTFTPMDAEKLLKEKKQHLSLQIYRLKESIEDFEERAEEIRKQFAGDSDKVNRLLNVNYQEQQEKRETLVQLESLYQYLFKSNIELGPEDETQEYYLESLIGLPYMILVNMDTSTIFVKFHERIFEGVSDRDRNRSEVNETNLRIPENLG